VVGALRADWLSSSILLSQSGKAPFTQFVRDNKKKTHLFFVRKKKKKITTAKRDKKHSPPSHHPSTTARAEESHCAVELNVFSRSERKKKDIISSLVGLCALFVGLDAAKRYYCSAPTSAARERKKK
jgi:hypothetical protein